MVIINDESQFKTRVYKIKQLNFKNYSLAENSQVMYAQHTDRLLASI